MLFDKWEKYKESMLEGLDPIKDQKAYEMTAKLLENEKTYLEEAAPSTASGTGNIARFDKIAMPLIRRVVPATISLEIVGNQPMNAPVGIVNTLRHRYSSDVAAGGGSISVTGGEEADGVNIYEKYSLIASGEAYDASDARTNYQQTLAMEWDGGNEMNLDIVKKSIEAKTRRLQAKWSIEADQDARAMHSIDIEAEMVSTMSDEIIREIDREVLGDLHNLAGTVKAFDFALADGRYAAEKFNALTIGISDLSHEIARKTKRGMATWMVVSPNVLTALRHANNGAFTPASGDIQYSRTPFVGTYNGNIRVFSDIYATSDTVLLGYKGASELDTGYVYSPYIPLMQSNVLTDTTSYNQQVALMTRYATTTFTDTTTDLGNSADFYARGTVSNLQLGFGS